MERETRFTADVLNAAADRFTALVGEAGDVHEAASALGWSTLATAELADEEYDRVCMLSPSGHSQVTMAFREGMLLGALAADITMERAFGLAESTC